MLALTFRRQSLQTALVILIPSLIYSLHASLFRNWIIDDAGITFVYARSLAQGFGLVAQPGRLPVEGYSNFTWVLLLAPFFWLRLFDPTLTPKLVSSGLVLAAFIFIYRTLAAAWPRPKALALLALSLLALNSSFVIWTTSGLENALYVCLLSALCFGIIRSLTTRSGQMWPLALGGLAALIALTRPDGVLFVLVFPAVLALTVLWTRAQPWRLAARRLGLYLLVFGLMFGGYLLFRHAYFGAWAPNTYYAKGGPSAQSLLALLLLRWDVLFKFYLLTASLAGKSALLLVPAALLATLYLLRAGRLGLPQAALLLFLAVSAAVYMLLPDDWMGEFRFATPFIVFAYLYALTLAAAVLPAWVRPPAGRVLAASLAATLALAVSLHQFWPRTLRFAANPTVPFRYVTDTFALKFNDAAARLDLPQASLLLPDVGGALYYSQLTIYDLGGLTDKTIAQTMEHDQPAFYDYVFTTLQPTFIHTHGDWDITANLDADPRFRRDYIALHEYPDAEVRQINGTLAYSGDYVQRAAVRDRLPALYALRLANGQTDLSYAALLQAFGYRLPAPPTPADLAGLTPVNLEVGGAARLLGYRLSARAVVPGGTLTLSVLWQPEAATRRPQLVFVSLDEPLAGNIAELDTPPLDGAYPTSVWLPGQAFLDTYVLTIPPGAPAGSAGGLAVGLYDPQTLQRLPVTDTATGRVWPDEGAVLGRIEVRP